MHDHPHHPHDHGPHLGHHNHPPTRGNNAPGARQWQTPHLPEQTQAALPPEPSDLDLVETAFVDAFPRASDPVSFLRLAGVPFEGTSLEGHKLVLLRVEVEDVTDVGALMPHLGGAGFRYDPLPGKLTSNRKRLAFVYFDGAGIQALSLRSAQTLSHKIQALAASSETS
jgi:hypothetical protein